MRRLIVLIAALLGGCASYVTPGAPANLEAIHRADIAEVASRSPAAVFPARLAIVRVQARDDCSYSSGPIAVGSYSVVPTQELLATGALGGIAAWPRVQDVALVNRLLLPSRLESLDDLRVAAARLRTDILFVYTVDTQFRVRGHGFGPLSVISLGLVPDRDACVDSTASAMFTDVRTGFVYGITEATATATGLTNAWGSSDTLDRKRLEAERAAVSLLLLEAGRTWQGIIGEHGAMAAAEAARPSEFQGWTSR